MESVIQSSTKFLKIDAYNFHIYIYNIEPRKVISFFVIDIYSMVCNIMIRRSYSLVLHITSSHDQHNTELLSSTEHTKLSFCAIYGTRCGKSWPDIRGTSGKSTPQGQPVTKPEAPLQNICCRVFKPNNSDFHGNEFERKSFVEGSMAETSLRGG